MVLLCSNTKIANTPFVGATASPRKAEVVVKVDGVLVVRLADGRFMTSATDFHKWEYPIGHRTGFREPVIRGLQKIGFITKAEADEHMEEHKKAHKENAKKYAAEHLKANAKTLGIKLTKAQLEKLP